MKIYRYQHNLTYRHFPNDFLGLFEWNRRSMNRILKNIIDHRKETFFENKQQRIQIFFPEWIIDLPGDIDFTSRSKFDNRWPKDSSI